MKLLAPVIAASLVLSASEAVSQQVLDPDPNAAQATIAALTGLIPLKMQADFGVELVANQGRAKSAGFLKANNERAKSVGFLALLANKETLLHVKAEADRPNYDGNAAAKTKNNLWRAIIEGKVAPSSVMPAKPKD